MQQKATELKLSPNQWSALESRLSGATVTEAAATAGVDRTTVHRWLKEPPFMAAYNRGLAELRDATHARMYLLAEGAAHAVKKAIDAGNVNVALVVLKGTGFLSGQGLTVGPDEPERLRRLQEQATRQQQLVDALTDY